MSTAQQLGLIGNSIKVQSLPTASAETFGAGNRFYTLIGQQEGYITGHTYRTVMANDVYSWEDVAYGNYNMLDNIPVINQDLTSSGFTPVNGTYYRHTGTTNTYTQGVIYYYDGTEYKALDGSGGGGISDVKVNGTSVVTDGVANIPAANKTTSGVITSGSQEISGYKTFIPYPSFGLCGFKFSFDKSYTAATLIPSNSGNAFIGSNYNPMNRIYTIYLSASYIRKSDGGSNVDIPTYSGTMMVAPSTWSSGTSGSVTLTESGTYQIYMNDGKNNINFGLVYYDGTTDTYTQAVMQNDNTAYFANIVGGVITAYDVSITGHSYTANTNTIYYRRIGI